MKTYTKAAVERIRRFGDVAAGVPFDSAPTSPDCIGFTLIREAHHTYADIEAAKKWLRARRDIPGRIAVATVVDDVPLVMNTRDPQLMTDAELAAESLCLDRLFWSQAIDDRPIPNTTNARLSRVNMEITRRTVPTHSKKAEAKA